MNSYKVRTVNGVITPRKQDEASFKRLLTAFEDNKEEYLITIEKVSKSVNSNQIKLYKAIVLQAVDLTGHSFNEIEQELFNRYLPTEIKNGLLGVYKTVITLEDLNTFEFNNFLKQSVIFLNKFFNLKIELD